MINKILSVILLSAFLSALMPEGNAKSGVKMMSGLIVFLMISEFLVNIFSNLE